MDTTTTTTTKNGSFIRIASESRQAVVLEVASEDTARGWIRARFINVARRGQTWTVSDEAGTLACDITSRAKAIAHVMAVA